VESVLQDLRFGVRILLRSPAITLAVILALGLGIGANSAMFSVVDALLLRPFQYRDPATLALLRDRDVQGALHGASAANFLDWRAHAKSFSDLAGWWQARSFVLTGGDRVEQIAGATVTDNFFRTLGVKPALGRTFLPGEDGIDNPAAASKVAIIGYRLWQDSFGADPNILGRNIKLDSTSYVIIGVMQPDFQFYWRAQQVWIPITLDRANRDYHYLMVIGRLNTRRESASAEVAGNSPRRENQNPKSGWGLSIPMSDKVARESAVAETAAIARSLEAEYPKSNKGWSIQVDDFREFLVNRSFRTRLVLLFGAVGLVLLIACANIASLMLARSAARNREIAVRTSLGATRSRLTRQLLTESVLLSILGGALGLGFAWLLIRAAPAVIPPDAMPAAAPIELNGLVAAFTFFIAVATGLLFGLAPALSVTRSEVHDSLKDSSRGSTSGRSRQRFRQVMVVTEVALALMLLASAGLMIESLRRMYNIELGFNPKNVLMLRLFLPSAKYNSAQALAFHREARERIAALPGVSSVAIASNLPLQRYSMEVPFDLESSPPREQGERPGVAYVSIGLDYLRTLGIPLKRGRAFTEADNQSAPPVAIVNEAFAHRYFPHEDPMGQRILLNRPILGKNGFEDTIRPEIVGVIGNVKLSDLTAGPEPMLYVPQEQNLWSAVSWFVVRSAGNPAGLSAAIRHELMQIDKDQPIDQVSSVEQTFSNRFADARFQTQLMGAFALVALLLAIVGIYGVNSYVVAQRRHEIGLRMALGASPSRVLREVLGQGMRLTAIGIVIGLTGAAAIASLLKSVLVGVSATDPAMLAGVALLLAFVAAIACYIPARKATRIDPALALRQE
jgi:predicted permease